MFVGGVLRGENVCLQPSFGFKQFLMVEFSCVTTSNVFCYCSFYLIVCFILHCVLVILLDHSTIGLVLTI